MNREYRELQVSTTALIFIILGVLILGTVIFFLGVQVGKKQVELTAKTFLSQKTEEKVTAPTPVVPVEETQSHLTQPVSSYEKSTESSSEQSPPAEQKKTASETESQSALSSRPASTPSSADNKVQEPSLSSGTPTRSKTSTRATSPAVSSGNFFIQVGAFNDRPSAQLAAERFKKLGYNAVVKEPFPRDRKPLYRVWVGGYKTREEAQKVLNEINASSARRTGYFIVQQ